MQQEFNKFKKRVWLHILIACAVAAVMAGFIAAIAVLLPCRLYGIKLFWLYYVLIALGGMALGFGITFLLLRTNDQKIARRLDSELNLNERVVTALTFRAREGEMYTAQREDARKSLARLGAKSLRFRHLLLTAICGALALVMLVAVPVVSVAVPPVFAAVQPDDGPKEPPREVTDWEWHALDDLIAYVRNSKKADAESKTAMLSQLNNLKNVLLDGVSQSSLKSFVESCVTGIRNSLRQINSALASEEQQTANTEEGDYVIARLYEIFDIAPAIGGNGEDDPPGSDEQDPNNPGGGTGPGGLDISDLPFFDRDLGSVLCGEVRDEYYERALKALEEGLISEEEWQLIMATYFSDLNDKND